MGVPTEVKAKLFLPEDLLQLVSRLAGCTVAELKGHRRKRYLVRARVVVAMVLRERIIEGRPMSYARIGRYLNRDFKTIRYHIVGYNYRYSDDRLASEMMELARSEYKGRKNGGAS